MALMLHSSSFATKKPYLLLHTPNHHLYSHPKPRNVSIRSQDPSPQPSPEPQESTTTSSTVAPPPKKPTSAAGLGFGSTTSSAKSDAAKPPVSSSKKKQKGKEERATIIRRAPVDKPTFASPKEQVQANEQAQNESAFLLTWLGLGAIILVQGIVLAASGFLPEEWDNFFVKYLYPSFTPTVALFGGWNRSLWSVEIPAK